MAEINTADEVVKGLREWHDPIAGAHVSNVAADRIERLETELRRYKQALTRANGFLIMNNLEPVKLEHT